MISILKNIIAHKKVSYETLNFLVYVSYETLNTNIKTKMNYKCFT